MWSRFLICGLCAAIILGVSDPAEAAKRKKRVGSSTPTGVIDLAPVKPNAPVGPDLTAPRVSPSMPRPLVMPQPQPPYVAPSGVYAVPPRRSGETFQDRAVRCQHSAQTLGVPGESRGSYVHNCAM